MIVICWTLYLVSRPISCSNSVIMWFGWVLTLYEQMPTNMRPVGTTVCPCIYSVTAVCFISKQMSSSCLSNYQYIVPPICKILVNCEHILSCYMSKASLKKLGLYASDKGDNASSPRDLGFSLYCWWALKCVSPCPLPSPVRPVVDTARQYFHHFTDLCKLLFSFWLIFYGFNIPPPLPCVTKCYYIKILRISMIYFLQWK